MFFDFVFFWFKCFLNLVEKVVVWGILLVFKLVYWKFFSGIGVFWIYVVLLEKCNVLISIVVFGFLFVISFIWGSVLWIVLFRDWILLFKDIDLEVL